MSTVYLPIPGGKNAQEIANDFTNKNLLVAKP
jgi:hypothetical protein